MRVDDWLARARSSGVDRLDGQLLLCSHLGKPRSWLLAHGDDLLAPAVANAALQSLARRAEGVPLAYLVGTKEFHGLSLTVTPDVLVPRPETETLLEWALEVLTGKSTPVTAIDLGTGSGALAVALALAQRDPRCNVVASDASEAALRVAAANARRHGARVELRCGSWWEVASAGERFDMAVSNPPYIAEDDAHLPALRHEPQEALVSGRDGLDAVRSIVAGAGEHLSAHGWLLLEHGHDQGDAVRRLLVAAGFDAVETRNDLAGRERCTGGRRPPADS